MRKLLGAVVLCVLNCAVLVAADFWETKPFSMWSAEELQKVLTDSPWSRNVSIPATQPVLGSGGVGEGEGGGGGGARGGGGGDAGGGGAGGGGRGGGRGGGGPNLSPRIKLVVSWRSALPMKQALVRDRVGIGGAVPAESQQLLERTEMAYVVTLMGLPARYARMINSMKAETFLKRDHKSPIAVDEMAVQQAAAAPKTPAFLVVVFGFPRTDAIKLDDKEIEFATKLGLIDIKKKFNLKDMVFHGQLEL